MMEAFEGVSLLAVTARATLVLGAAALLAWTLRRAPAGTRHSLWTATFVLLVSLPAAVVWAPSWELALLPPTAGGPVGDVAGVAGGPQLAEDVWGATRPVFVIGAAPAVRWSVNTVSTSAGEQRSGLSLVGVLWICWAVGVVAAFGSLLIGRLRFRALVRDARPIRDPVWLGQVDAVRERLGIDRDVRVLCSGRVSTPMTGGILHPVVLLPASATTWTPERRWVVLTHELIHVRRHDVLRQLVGTTALALYWFHPLGWLAQRQATMSREQACDEKVLTLGTRPSEYAAHLLDLAGGMRPAPAVLALSMIQPSQLERRLMSILAPHRPRRSAFVTALALTLIGGLGISAAIAQPVPARPVQEGLPRVPKPAMLPEPVALPLFRPEATRLPGLPTLPEPVTLPSLPPIAVPTADPMPPQEASCRMEGMSGSFSGTLSTTGARTEQSGFHNGDRTIQKYVGDLRLCMRIHGDVVMSDNDDEVRAIGADSWVVLESEEDDLHRLVITEGTAGLEYEWSVNDRPQTFDADARTWRDQMLTVLGGYWEAARLRGQQASMRGQIAAQRGQIASQRGRISSLTAVTRSSSNADTRARLDAEIVDVEVRIREIETQLEEQEVQVRVSALEAEISEYVVDETIRQVEAELADYDVDAKVSEVDAEIETLDADRRAEAIERRIEPELEALRRLIRRL